MGLVGVLTSLVMLAFFLNIVPDRKSAIRQGRADLAETIAVYSTALVKTAESKRLRDDFNLLADRNEELLSLATDPARSDWRPVLIPADAPDRDGTTMDEEGDPSS